MRDVREESVRAGATLRGNNPLPPPLYPGLPEGRLFWEGRGDQWGDWEGRVWEEGEGESSATERPFLPADTGERRAKALRAV